MPERDLPVLTGALFAVAWTIARILMHVLGFSWSGAHAERSRFDDSNLLALWLCAALLAVAALSLIAFAAVVREGLIRAHGEGLAASIAFGSGIAGAGLVFISCALVASGAQAVELGEGVDKLLSDATSLTGRLAVVAAAPFVVIANSLVTRDPHPWLPDSWLGLVGLVVLPIIAFFVADFFPLWAAAVSVALSRSDRAPPK